VPPQKPPYDWDRTIELKTAFPTPKNSTLRFPELCEYYNALRELPIARYAKIYIGRWWPVLLPIEGVDDYGNPKDSFPNDVKITVEDGPLSEQLLLQLAGVGEYHFRLNDMRRPWKQQTIVFSQAEWVDPTLWTLHPPIIDPKRLDMEARRNQAYIKFARAHGYLPREGEEQKEQAEMAQTAVVDSVLEDARRERARADQIQREALERAQAEAKEAKAQAAIKPAEPVRPTSDLEAMGNVITNLVNAVKPNPDNSLTKYLELEAAREETRRATEKAEREASRTAAMAERERADKLQSEILADLRAKATPTAPVAPIAPLTRRQMFEDAIAEQAAIKQLAGRGGHAEEEKPDKIDKWLEAAPIIAPIFQSVVGGFFQFGLAALNTFQVVSFNNALARTGGTPQPPTTMQQPPEPGKPIPPQAPAPTAEQIAQQQQWDLIMRGVTTLAPHLIRHKDKGKTGADLAEFVIENADEGRTSYDRIRHLSDSLERIGIQVPGGTDLEKFTNAARFVFEKVPVLNSKVLTDPTMPEFLRDFFDYDEIREKEQDALENEK
jgi:hypothetical protein